jgi:hypothetical protein
MSHGAFRFDLLFRWAEIHVSAANKGASRPASKSFRVTGTISSGITPRPSSRTPEPVTKSAKA